jgi:hypothetical protein
MLGFKIQSEFQIQACTSVCFVVYLMELLILSNGMMAVNGELGRMRKKWLCYPSIIPSGTSSPPSPRPRASSPQLKRLIKEPTFGKIHA